MLSRRIPPESHSENNGGSQCRSPEPNLSKEHAACVGARAGLATQLFLHRQASLELREARLTCEVVLLERVPLCLRQAVEQVRLQNLPLFHFFAVHHLLLCGKLPQFVTSFFV